VQKHFGSFSTFLKFCNAERKTRAGTADSGGAVKTTDGELLEGASVICRGTAKLRNRKVTS
jgi:hypothetical protein